MRRYSAKETYNFKEPTDRSHPVPNDVKQQWVRALNSCPPLSSFATELCTDLYPIYDSKKKAKGQKNKKVGGARV